MKNLNEDPAIAHGPDDAFRLLGIGRTLGFSLLKSGELPSFQIGGRRLIRRADLEAFVAKKAAHHAA